jgi:ornithine--oxo-acid transaminase
MYLALLHLGIGKFFFKDQSRKLTLTSRAFRNDQLGLFYRELCELTNSNKVLHMNSGAEAVETVIKTVRKWGYKIKGVQEDQAEIIVCENNTEFEVKTYG